MAGTPVTFDSSASSDPDGTIVSFAWSFGDGGTASVPSPTHTYVASGSYSVQLTVTDNGGRTAQVTRTVTIVLSSDVGWISPVSFVDASNQWANEERAYDNDVGSRTSVSLTAGQSSSDLVLALPGSGVLSDRLRVNVSDSSPNPAHFFTWTVEAFVDGVWVQIYSAKPTIEKQWVELAFTQGTVTQVRLRARNDAGDRWLVYLWELDVHDSTVGP
jgi:PKD repeat protein